MPGIFGSTGRLLRHLRPNERSERSLPFGKVIHDFRWIIFGISNLTRADRAMIKSQITCVCRLVRYADPTEPGFVSRLIIREDAAGHV
ncbi:hypothetical protein D3C81_1644270 [compost metagenome]